MDAFSLVQFHEDHPSVGMTASFYAEAITQEGFGPAHQRLLQELQAWFTADPTYQIQRAEMLAHVLRLTERLLLAVLDMGVEVPQNCQRLAQTLFGAVFGVEGQAYLEGQQRELVAAQQRFEEVIQEYMTSLGISRYEAEILYREAIDEHLHLVRTMGPLRQVEDTLGRITWEGDEPRR